MSIWHGDTLSLEIYGTSHGPEIGMILTGLPEGTPVDLALLQTFLDRRAPDRNAFSTARKEGDVPVFEEGLAGGLTDGGPLKGIIKNTNVRSGDYDNLRTVPRPGHADFTAMMKYGEKAQLAGGGPVSGRLTAPLCIAGGICLQLLEKEGIQVFARIRSSGAVQDEGCFTAPVSGKAWPTVSDGQGEAMQQLILEKKAEGDSVGGIVECVVTGLPAGLGGPLFDGLEGRIASLVYGIPAVKGVEFGAGFGAALLCGSENNDPFVLQGGRVVTATNNAGGILGGISNGMPLVFRAAFKPTPSIAKVQKSVDLSSMTEVELQVQGRHDPCIVLRAVPCVEAAAAVAVYDALLQRRKELAEDVAGGKDA